MSPLTLLIIGILLVAGLILVFYPGFGMIYRFKRNKTNNTRVLTEDALKYIYDCEYNQNKCSINSIAGNLHISADKSAKLADILEEMNLIEYVTDNIRLTSEGRSYALRIIRFHRLWEQYLADETSINETEWHSSAEEAEHILDEEKANQLAAQIGNPVIDPHGDPIPTPEGEIKAKRGIPLSQLTVGEQGRIVHIEDEPESIYSQIVASGIHNGMQIRLVEVEKNKIKFIAEGEEILLSPLIAANLTVLPEKKSDGDVFKDFKTLATLRKNEEAVVIGISKSCRGQQRRRLMDLGIVSGSKIKNALESAGKDPIAYLVRGANVALRRAQAEQIFISKVGEEK